MSNSRGLGWFGLLLLLGLGARIAQTDLADGHLQGEACEGCHLARKITVENARELIGSQEALCGRCHADAIRVSHPSGFPVSRTLPAAFPKDWKGDLTCSTCHEIHGNHGGLMRVVESGYALCSQCHDDQFFARMRDGGQSMMHSGHLQASGEYYTLELDAYSLKCMECHAEKSSVGEVQFTGNVLRHGGGAMNHPIGSDYRVAEEYGGYRARAMLKKAILLPDDKLSCVSCHDGYSQQHGELVIGDDRLCFECHDK